MPFLVNPLGLKALTRDLKMHSVMAELAQQLEAEAQAIAPVATGEFQASLRGEVHLGTEGWEARLVTDSPYWPFLEFGTSDTPLFATLRRALEAAKL